MVSFMVLLPLLLALVIALGAAFYVLQRKSLAQAICVQEATRLQTDLRKPLRQLVALNPQAAVLRAKRQAADKALRAALVSGVPYAIALAEAAETAAIAEQVAFRARQEMLLNEAAALRADGQRRLRLRASRLGAIGVTAPVYYPRALAVKPVPLASLTPDYRPVETFEYSQQQRYRFEIDLLRGWPGPHLNVDSRQSSECSATLKGEDQQWQLHLLAAKASSSW